MSKRHIDIPRDHYQPWTGQDKIVAAVFGIMILVVIIFAIAIGMEDNSDNKQPKDNNKPDHPAIISSN